jgi:hypothetical protein
MTSKSEWNEANRRLKAEQREQLGDPPTAEEMLAYCRGQLSGQEEERIRDLLVAYPELARMYAAPFPEEGQPGVTSERIAASLGELERRLGGETAVVPHRRRMRHYIPTTIAAAFALVFFGLFVQAENRARLHQREGQLPRILGAPQELDPDGNRGPAEPTLLRRDGEAYLLKPRLINQVRYPRYSIELQDETQVVWRSHSAEPDEDDAFQIVIPHGFLRAGGTYQLRVYGIDGETRRQVGSYDVAVPSE